MITKTGIVINNPQLGIAPSSYFGYEEIRNLNITDKPGTCYPNYATTQDDVVTPIVDTRIIGMTEGSDVWGHDAAQKVYVRTAQDTWVSKTGHTASNISGIAYYKNYIAIIHTDRISWYKNSDNSFYVNWGAASITNGGTIKPTVIAQDGKLYLGSGDALDIIEEVDGQNFDPNSGTTYTVTKATIYVPEDEGIKKIIEIGDFEYLVCDYKIYPWKRGATSFSNPINVNKIIHQVIAYNNTLYIQAGYKGEWFYANGTTVLPFAKIPETLVNLGTGQIQISKPCVRNELIFFGVGGVSSFTPQAVYSLNPANGKINIEYTISTGGFGTTNTITFGQIFSLGSNSDGLLIPWSENSVHGVDRLNGGTGYTSDKAFSISQFYRLGTKLNEQTFKDIDVICTKPLASGDSIKIWYRTAQNGSWTTGGGGLITTFNTVGKQEFNFPFKKSLKNVQFKISQNDEAELLEFKANYA